MKIEKCSHDDDYCSWLKYQSWLIKEKKFDELDCDILSDELKLFAVQKRVEVENYVVGLIMSIIQYKAKSTQMKLQIKELRKKIHLMLKESPSLKIKIEKDLNHLFDFAMLKLGCMDDIILPFKIEHLTLPFFTFDQLIDKNYWPE